MGSLMKNVNRCAAFFACIGSLGLLQSSPILCGQMLQDELVTAVVSGNLNAVIDCLGRGANPNRKGFDESGDRGLSMPLHCAMFRGSTKIVETLLRAGANVNRKAHGWEPLEWAACQGYKEIAMLLLQNGAKSTRKALEWATRKGHTSIVTLLLEAGVDLRLNRALSDAASKGHGSIVRLLLDAGAKVTTPTVLIKAARHGHARVIKTLLCAKIFLQQEWKRNALWNAAYKGHESVVKELLQNGLNADCQIQVKGQGGKETALIAASKNNHCGVMQLLLQAGAKPSDRALCGAAKKGYVDAVRLLVQAGADLNGDYYSCFPYFEAPSRGLVLIEALLEDHAELNLQVPACSPMASTAWMEREYCAQLLLQRGAGLPTNYQSNECLKRNAYLAHEWAWHMEQAVVEISPVELPNDLKVLIRKMATNVSPVKPMPIVEMYSLCGVLHSRSDSSDELSSSSDEYYYSEC